MPDFVNNVDGTSKRKCQCLYGSKDWISHWERGTGLVRPLKCCAKWCSDYAVVGAHVKHVGSDQRIVWIIPFCQYHNKRPSNMDIELKLGVMLCGAAKIDCA